MNTTSSTEGYDAADTILHSLSWVIPSIISIMGTLMIGYLLFVTIVKDLPQKDRPVTFANVFSPSNRLILGLLACGLIAYMAIIAYYNFSHEERPWVFALAWSVLGVANTCNIWFNFLRSTSILRSQSSAATYSFFSKITYLVPVFSLAPAFVVFAPESWTTISKNVLFASLLAFVHGTPTLLLEVYFAYSFTCHIRNIQAQLDQEENHMEKQKNKLDTEDMGSLPRTSIVGTQKVDTLLLIVSKWGLLTVIVQFNTMGLVTGALICTFISPELPRGSLASVLHHFFWIMKDISLLFIGLCIFRMKLELVKQYESEQSLAYHTKSAQIITGDKSYGHGRQSCKS
ncbi:hypothetical protein BCR33DRAFT_710897, partial [Rhizoclosmatium globosum]